MPSENKSQNEVKIGLRQLESTLQLDPDGSMDQLYQHLDALGWSWLDGVPREDIVFVRDAEVVRESFDRGDVLEDVSVVEDGDQVRVAVLDDSRGVGA